MVLGAQSADLNHFLSPPSSKEVLDEAMAVNPVDDSSDDGSQSSGYGDFLSFLSKPSPPPTPVSKSSPAPVKKIGAGNIITNTVAPPPPLTAHNDNDIGDDESEASSASGSSGFADFKMFLRSPSKISVTKADDPPTPKMIVASDDSSSNDDSSVDSAFVAFKAMLKAPSPASTPKPSVVPKVVASPIPAVTVAKAAPKESIVPRPAEHATGAVPAKAVAPTAAIAAAGVVAATKNQHIQQDETGEVGIESALVSGEEMLRKERETEYIGSFTARDAVEDKPSTASDGSASGFMSKADIAASEASLSVHLPPDAPAAVEYFTRKAAEDAARHRVEMRELAKANMADAHLYFDKIAYEQAVKNAEEYERLINAPRPAAVEFFTGQDIEAKAAKKLENELAVNEPMPEGQAHFTNRWLAEKERAKAEIEDMKINPPPAPAATEYFKVKEAERQVEIEKMMNEPAPAAIEFFSQQARAEEEKNRRAYEARNKNGYEPPIATKHFADKKIEKATEIEAAREQTRQKDRVEQLPIDYFTKQGEAEMAAKAEEMRKLADAEMPVGIRYFTEKGKDEAAAKYAEHMALGEKEMPAATKHFKHLAEKGDSGLGESDVMPAAIQHFTTEANIEREKKRQEIKELNENPPPMPDGQAYFTNRWLAEKERSRAEIEEMKVNPPPAPAATEYFKVKEAERKAEIEKMMNEPAPAAVEFFTKQARDEEEKNRQAYEARNGGGSEPPLATKYFADLEKKKAADIDAARSQINKGSMKPLPIDYFTKLGQEQNAEKARKAKELADAEIPDAVLYFTDKAEYEKEYNQLVGVNNQNMPVATKYFEEKAKADEAKARAAESEVMPAAVQKFSMPVWEQHQKNRAELEKLKNNPPPIPSGVLHFTPELQSTS